MEWTKPEKPTKENPLVVYMIVRESLGMGIGKMVAQGGHSIQLLLKHDRDLRKLKTLSDADKNKTIRMDIWKDYNVNGGFRKVALSADEKEWKYIKENYDPVIVVDAGLTEVAPGSETVMVLFPILKSERCKTLKRMRCL